MYDAVRALKTRSAVYQCDGHLIKVWLFFYYRMCHVCFNFWNGYFIQNNEKKETNKIMTHSVRPSIRLSVCRLFPHPYIFLELLILALVVIFPNSETGKMHWCIFLLNKFWCVCVWVCVCDILQDLKVFAIFKFGIFLAQNPCYHLACLHASFHNTTIFVPMSRRTLPSTLCWSVEEKE